MRFLLVDTDYAAFTAWFEAREPGFSERSHADQLSARRRAFFGTASSYAHALRELGHEAHEVFLDNRSLQAAWAREHGVPWQDERRRLGWRLRKGVIPWPSPRVDRPWLLAVLEAQIAHHRPDVLLVMNLYAVPVSFLARVKPLIGAVVGQHAVGRLGADDWSVYDLVTSSSPATVAWFTQRGVPAALNRLAFDPRALDLLEPRRELPATFIGSCHSIHVSRMRWLERVCALHEVHVSTADVAEIPRASAVRRHLEPAEWGRGMLSFLRHSRLTLNHHGDVADHANNMRLFEATGVGTLLITDAKSDLGELFEVGKEVVAYRTPEECAELIAHYLAHEDERRTIAAAGQRRTLTEHAYVRRTSQLTELLLERCAGLVARRA
jgi:hypothetical protein